MKTLHSVTLDKESCTGCTNCVKRCPTEAIRVRDKKASIITERCIDCGECIRQCPHHAKKAVMDPLTVLSNFEYTIALPAPTLYAQFRKVRDRNIILTALKRIGFSDTFEVSSAAEAVSAATREELRNGKIQRPIISTACPTVVRIITARFPSLIENLLPYRAPMELAARWAKQNAMKKTGLSEDKIGCVFISPCPAKATSMKNPLGDAKSYVDAVVSIAEVYPKLQNAIKQIGEPEKLARSGPIGIGWAMSGGECKGADSLEHLAADGMENVIRILEALEDEKLSRVDFVELNACVGGCVGGVLTVENPFIAKARLDKMIRASQSEPLPDDLPENEIQWDDRVEYDPIFQLDTDVFAAMQKMSQVEAIEKLFPGMDCGACGAPSCHALAEDIVMGKATQDQCIFLIQEKLKKLLDEKEDNK